MSFTNVHDFLAMGGYAAYVWPAYALFFVVLMADTLVPVVRRRQVLRDLRAQLARQAARRARKAGDSLSIGATNSAETASRSA